MATSTSTGSAASARSFLGYCRSGRGRCRAYTDRHGARSTRSITNWKSSWPRSCAVDSLCRDGPLCQVRRRSVCHRGAHRPRRHGARQDSVLRLPRLARLVSRRQPGGRGQPQRAPLFGDRADRRAARTGGHRAAVRLRRPRRPGRAARRHRGRSRRSSWSRFVPRVRPRATCRCRQAGPRTWRVFILDEVSAGLRFSTGGSSSISGHARHGGLRQVDLQRLPDGGSGRQTRGHGAGGADVYFQHLLERHDGPAGRPDDAARSAPPQRACVHLAAWRRPEASGSTRSPRRSAWTLQCRASMFTRTLHFAVADPQFKSQVTTLYIQEMANAAVTATPRFT